MLAFECTLSVNNNQNNFAHFLVYFNVLTRENKSAGKTITKVTLKFVIKLGKKPILYVWFTRLLLILWHMFQPFRFVRNIPFLRVCLLSAWNLSFWPKHVQIFKIEIQPVCAVIHLRFCKVCAEKWQIYNISKLSLSA